MKRVLITCVMLFLIFEIANARPQYSILQSFGTKCQNCHIAPNIGLQRNMSGWMSFSDVALIKPEDLGINPVYDAIRESNTLFTDEVTFGLDFRYQSARWPTTKNKIVVYDNLFDPNIKDTIPYTDPYGTKRDNMLMILTPYLTITPVDGVIIEGSYNFAYEIENKKRYPGQTPYTASIILHPFDKLPSLRIGMVQATIGTDWDDHTVMTRQVVTKTLTPPTIPCDYFELGAILDYEPFEWADISLGVFDSKNLSEMTNGFVKDNTLSGLAKVTLHPPDFGTGLTSFLGATHFFNSTLKMDGGIYFGNRYLTASSIFFHFGVPGKFAVMTEYMRTELSQRRITNNFTVEFNYQVIEPAYAYLRLERGNTEMKTAGNAKYHANRYTLGAKIFLLPYIALIPEYKIFDREHVDKFNSQFAFQLHIFY
ncbi:MAG TPA: hypothetical protein PL149_09700 [Candidatus Kapabacteria bacterium]|jgi:hypothetical protein|nr:hypothetical protein [Candidatus Kapabacteria bacterium]HPU24408.1 hypothetical protein [Candidatus Kapabacteria bacterium]